MESSRIRSVIRFGLRAGELNKWTFEDGKITYKDVSLPSADFSAVLQPSATQEDVFAEFKDFPDKVVNGYECSIFVFGSEGSGQSFTVFGPDVTHQDRVGLLPRLIQGIFRSLSGASVDGLANVSVSAVATQDDELYDVLASEGAAEGGLSSLLLPGEQPREKTILTFLESLHVLGFVTSVATPEFGLVVRVTVEWERCDGQTLRGGLTVVHAPPVVPAELRRAEGGGRWTLRPSQGSALFLELERRGLVSGRVLSAPEDSCSLVQMCTQALAPSSDAAAILCASLADARAPEVSELLWRFHAVARLATCPFPSALPSVFDVAEALASLRHATRAIDQGGSQEQLDRLVADPVLSLLLKHPRRFVFEGGALRTDTQCPAQRVECSAARDRLLDRLSVLAALEMRLNSVRRAGVAQLSDLVRAHGAYAAEIKALEDRVTAAKGKNRRVRDDIGALLTRQGEDPAAHAFTGPNGDTLLDNSPAPSFATVSCFPQENSALQTPSIFRESIARSPSCQPSSPAHGCAAGASRMLLRFEKARAERSALRALLADRERWLAKIGPAPSVHALSSLNSGAPCGLDLSRDQREEALITIREQISRLELEIVMLSSQTQTEARAVVEACARERSICDRLHGQLRENGAVKKRTQDDLVLFSEQLETVSEKIRQGRARVVALEAERKAAAENEAPTALSIESMKASLQSEIAVVRSACGVRSSTVIDIQAVTGALQAENERLTNSRDASITEALTSRNEEIEELQRELAAVQGRIAEKLATHRKSVLAREQQLNESKRALERARSNFTVLREDLRASRHDLDELHDATSASHCQFADATEHREAALAEARATGQEQARATQTTLECEVARLQIDANCHRAKKGLLRRVLQQTEAEQRKFEELLSALLSDSDQEKSDVATVRRSTSLQESEHSSEMATVQQRVANAQASISISKARDDAAQRIAAARAAAEERLRLALQQQEAEETPEPPAPAREPPVSPSRSPPAYLGVELLNMHFAKKFGNPKKGSFSNLHRTMRRGPGLQDL